LGNGIIIHAPVNAASYSTAPVANGPDFMVKAIADQEKIPMRDFPDLSSNSHCPFCFRHL
jgi:hypothetical protein